MIIFFFGKFLGFSHKWKQFSRKQRKKVRAVIIYMKSQLGSMSQALNIPVRSDPVLVGIRWLSNLSSRWLSHVVFASFQICTTQLPSYFVRPNSCKCEGVATCNPLPNLVPELQRLSFPPHRSCTLSWVVHDHYLTVYHNRLCPKDLTRSDLRVFLDHLCTGSISPVTHSPLINDPLTKDLW